MNIFISWSGKRSRLAAEFLKGWLKQVIQATDPWISSDIDKGKRWVGEMSKILSNTNYGLICLTPENIKSPWVLYESGALSKAPESSVSCLLIGIEPSDVEFPLAQFQHTTIEKEAIYKLVHSINEQLLLTKDKPLSPDFLSQQFETFYPAFEKKFKEIQAMSVSELQSHTVRYDRDLHQVVPLPIRSTNTNSIDPSEMATLIKEADFSLCLARIENLQFNRGYLSDAEFVTNFMDILRGSCGQIIINTNN